MSRRVVHEQVIHRFDILGKQAHGVAPFYVLCCGYALLLAKCWCAGHLPNRLRVCRFLGGTGLGEATRPQRLRKTSLEEEKAADKKLTQIAEARLNLKAAS
jgi:hypothetical protein